MFFLFDVISLCTKEKLPGSLEELWASRNHFDVKAMQLGLDFLAERICCHAVSFYEFTYSISMP